MMGRLREYALVFSLGVVVSLLFFYPSVDNSGEKGEIVGDCPGEIIKRDTVYIEIETQLPPDTVTKYEKVPVPIPMGRTLPDVGRINEYRGTALVNGHRLKYNLFTDGVLYGQEYAIQALQIKEVRVVNHVSEIERKNPWLLLVGAGIQFNNIGIQNLLIGADVGYERHVLGYYTGIGIVEMGRIHQLTYKRRFGW